MQNEENTNPLVPITTGGQIGNLSIDQNGNIYNSDNSGLVDINDAGNPEVKSDGLSEAAIAGIVVAIAFVIAHLAALAFIMYKRFRKDVRMSLQVAPVPINSQLDNATNQSQVGNYQQYPIDDQANSIAAQERGESILEEVFQEEWEEKKEESKMEIEHQSLNKTQENGSYQTDESDAPKINQFLMEEEDKSSPNNSTSRALLNVSPDNLIIKHQGTVLSKAEENQKNEMPQVGNPEKETKKVWSPKPIGVTSGKSKIAYDESR